MRILSCYIENFGTFSKESFEFQDGLNGIYRENGWGKTTLAAFLKAMLYGIEYNRATENERKKYLPWNEGKYGGFLCFEANGKRYRVERSFGRTDKNDSFALFDLATNMESRDYSENLGEELFGVDRESFEKSVFIQVDNPKESLLTDIMASRMSEIPAEDGDLNRLNEVLANLEKKATTIRAKRGNGGLLGVLRNQLSEEKRKLQECMDAQGRMEQESQKIKDCERREAAAREELQAIHDQIMVYQYAGRQDEYERLKTEVEECSRQIEKEKTFFKGVVPSVEEIDNIQEHITQYNVSAALSRENTVTVTDKEKLASFKSIFRYGIPTEEEMDQAGEAIHMLETARHKSQDSIVDINDIVRLEQLKERFAGKELTDEQIDNVIEKYEQIAGLEKHRDALLAKRKEKDEKQEKDARKYNSVMLSLFVVAGVVVLIGLVILVTLNTYLGIGMEIGGIVTAIVGYFAIKPVPHQDAAIGMLEEEKAREISADIEKLNLAYTGFISEYGRKDGETSPIKAFADIRADRDAYLELDKKISAMNAEHGTALQESSDIKQHVESFLELYGNDPMDEDYSARLNKLRENARDYRRIKVVIENHNQAVKNALEHKSVVYRFIEQYFPAVDHPAEQMRTIARKADGFRQLTEELARKQALLDNFCAANDTGRLNSMEKPEKTLEELGLEQQRITDAITEISGECMQAKQKCLEYAKEADKRNDLEASIERILGEIAEMEKEYRILNQTSELLRKSGEALSEKYMSDIEMAFQKYVQLLGHDKSNFRVDAQLNVRIDKDGSLHEKKTFSAGERDLAEICVRLALLDAVYKDGEKPVVIMDDPFVNLDDESLSRAKGLLKSLAREYQVIYFACQEGRMG